MPQYHILLNPDEAEECWTCGCLKGRNKIWRYALEKYEITCQECFQNEYPELCGEESEESEGEEQCVYEVVVEENECCKYFGEDVEEAKKHYFGLSGAGINMRHGGIVVYEGEEGHINYSTWKIYKPTKE